MIHQPYRDVRYVGVIDAWNKACLYIKINSFVGFSPGALSTDLRVILCSEGLNQWNHYDGSFVRISVHIT